jgi:hypothetical protein
MATPSNPFILTALVTVALAGCGEGAGGSGVRGANQNSAPENASADLWAEQAYSIYGKAAARSCLFAFEAGYPAEESVRGSTGGYRAALADYMCACARGESPHPCPGLAPQSPEGLPALE